MLELRSVGYRYPGYRERAIDGISLTVGAGEVVGLVGPRTRAGSRPRAWSPPDLPPARSAAS